MTLWTLTTRSLRFHWRAHLGVLLGATLSTAILVGALAVGDSVRYSLHALALARLGDVRLALNGQSRFFRAALADEIGAELQAPVAPVVLLRGTAATEERRVGRVQVVGVTERFWDLREASGVTRHASGEASGVRSQASVGGAPGFGGRTDASRLTPDASPAAEAVVLNERLARQLGVQVGGEVLLRVDKPSLLSRDAPLSSTEDSSVTLRLPVSTIAKDADFGRFSLEANQIPPYTAFVPLALLQQRIAMPGRANMLLVGQGAGAEPTVAAATAALERHWRLADAGLELRELPERGERELRTDRIFLDAPVAEAGLAAAPGARGVLTYFVNELRVGSHATPYSMVSAVQGGVVPPAMKDDEVLVNQWLADDLGAGVGDRLRLSYFVVGPMRRLEQQSREFRIRAVLPLEGAAADSTLMPAIPGLADRKNCRDWEPGIPIDLKKIRDKDEQYWHAYRGTPKAFLTLRAGQRIWDNRFGNLTAVRYPAGGVAREALAERLQERIRPAALGLVFAPVRAQALAASSQAMDFGQLFLGFSFFLIVAALLLTALLFAFGVEQRVEEIGTLLAVGFPPRRVQRLLLMEGALLALAAGVLGALAGVLYTRVVIRGLSTVWRGAVANSALRFHAEPVTLALGGVAGFVVALLAIFLVTRRQARAPARELLAAGTESEARLLAAAPSGRTPGLPTAIVTGVAALGLVGAALRGNREQAAEIFFSAGALLLVAGIAGARAFMARLRRGTAESHLTLGLLGVRNSIRRQGRSLTTIGLLACGSFLVIAVGANQQGAGEGAERRASGTGGFAYYGETTLPVFHDLNSAEGQDVFGLEASKMPGVQFVPLRLRPGDDASCLNLNRPQVPRLLGVATPALRERKAFTFGKLLHPSDDPWSALDSTEPDGAVPAVGDMNTVVWSLGKSLGDTLTYTDDHGRAFPVRIVGILANSILQGSLLISEANFVQRFPAQEGYQVFLVDALRESREIPGMLSRALEDVGLDIMPAPERLAAFNTVENTYLSIFAVLGGLGLLLGSIGLGVVVLRNVLERRGELALMRAVGFRRQALHWLVLSEHTLLLALGLLIGVVAALVAVLPALRAPGAAVPVVSLLLTLITVFASGFFWTWGATALAIRGSLMGALRNE
jgi:putative ABC transport system permease protein